MLILLENLNNLIQYKSLILRLIDHFWYCNTFIHSTKLGVKGYFTVTIMFKD